MEGQGRWQDTLDMVRPTVSTVATLSRIVNLSYQRQETTTSMFTASSWSGKGEASGSTLAGGCLAIAKFRDGTLKELIAKGGKRGGLVLKGPFLKCLQCQPLHYNYLIVVKEPGSTSELVPDFSH